MNLSAAGSNTTLRHDFAGTSTAFNTVLMPRTGKPEGIVQRDVMGAPRGIPPRGRPKWA
ncbi:MAG: hypothetical protein ACRD0P_04875 [Stackebrandtia sp.]